jgi:alkylhydroperoxidase/carboxymuconolactone decarboxylase family protein YurZ
MPFPQLANYGSSIFPAKLTFLSGGELYKTCIEKSGSLPEIDESPESMVEKGEQMMKIHYSHRYDRLRERMSSLHPSLDAWLVEFMYGRARSRPGFLTQRERQLCALSAMAGQIVSQQFRSTIMSALNDGSNLEEVRGVLDHTSLVWGESYQSMVDALWADLNKR